MDLDLRSLTDQELLCSIQNAYRTEREAENNMLRHLEEVGRRRLFSSLKFTSLFDYAVRGLGYSGDEAQRRISAMRMTREIPEIEEKLENGSISLTHIGIAQRLFNHEEKVHQRTFTPEEKLEIIEKIENTSTRDAQKITQSYLSSPIRAADQVRSIGGDLVRISFDAPEELEKQIAALKGLLAHSHPNISTADLFTLLCELGQKAWNPALQKSRSNRKASAHDALGPAKQETQLGTDALSQRQKISVHLKRQIWSRDQGKCTKCESTYALEIDHIQPIAVGGDNSPENLRLLCRSCNQRSAIKTFGLAQMEIFLQ